MGQILVHLQFSHYGDGRAGRGGGNEAFLETIRRQPSVKSGWRWRREPRENQCLWPLFWFDCIWGLSKLLLRIYFCQTQLCSKLPKKMQYKAKTYWNFCTNTWCFFSFKRSLYRGSPLLVLLLDLDWFVTLSMSTPHEPHNCIPQCGVSMFTSLEVLLDIALKFYCVLERC